MTSSVKRNHVPGKFWEYLISNFGLFSLFSLVEGRTFNFIWRRRRRIDSENQYPAGPTELKRLGKKGLTQFLQTTFPETQGVLIERCLWGFDFSCSCRFMKKSNKTWCLLEPRRSRTSCRTVYQTPSQLWLR